MPYGVLSNNGISFTVNKDKDGKETLSAKVVLATDKRVKATVFLTTTTCGLGLATIDMFNKGAEGYIAAVNSTSGVGFHDIVAYTELTNPVIVDPEKHIKRYEWKDILKINWNDQKWKDFLKDATPDGKTGIYPWIPIKELDGNYFAPIKNQRYHWGFVLEAIDDNGNPIETYNGVNEGSAGGAGDANIPELTNPKQMPTSVENYNAEEVSITLSSCWCDFIINCPSGVYVQSYAVYDISGRMLQTGTFSGTNSKESISSTELGSGVYLVNLTVTENGETKVITKKVIK